MNRGCRRPALTSVSQLLAWLAGLKDNLKLLRSTLCINPHLQQHITLFPLGLSSKNDTCWVVSDNNNVGDGFTMCGHNTSAEAQAAAQPGYSVRSSMLVRRLDDLLQEDVKVGQYMWFGIFYILYDLCLK